MNIFDYMSKDGFEQLIFCQDEASGLKAIIAIHDTMLGPALGGCRMWTYASEEEAIKDALRLARAMTYKNAAAGLNLGGGKTVIIGDPKTAKSEAMFRSLGRYIHSLNGRYITAEDVGTTEADMDLIHMETPYVTGTSELDSSGNPSPLTALGVFQGMRASAKERFGSDSLAGRTVAVQGVGSVGYYLCSYLHEAGAKLIAADINQENLRRVQERFGAQAVEPRAIYGAECDIFAPCAFGAILNDETITQLRCAIVAGSANNQLKEERHGDLLAEHGVLYAPDYVINAGGVINVAAELEGYHAERARKKVEGIYDILLKLFAIGREEGIPTYRAADRLAEQRIASLHRSTKAYVKQEWSMRKK